MEPFSIRKSWWLAPFLLVAIFGSLETFENFNLRAKDTALPIAKGNITVALQKDSSSFAIPSGHNRSDDYGNDERNITFTKSSTNVTASGPVRTSAVLVPYCSRDQIRKGQWQAVALDAPPYIPTNEYSKRCKTDQDYEPNVPWSTWEWKPSSTSCYFSSWNSTDFCNLASTIAIQQSNADSLVHTGTNISTNITTTTAGTPMPTLLFVGDSLTYEQYSSLTQLLGLGADEMDMHKAKRRNTAVERIGCTTSSNNITGADRTNQSVAASTWRLLSRRDDYLTYLQAYVKQYEPQVLVINRGAHHVDDNRLRRELSVTISFLEQWQQTCMEQSKTCLLYVRTTVPGHPLCSQYTEPSSSTEEMESLVANLTNYLAMSTMSTMALDSHWWDIKHQNELILETFARSKLTLWNHSHERDRSPQEHHHDAAGGYYRVLDAYDINLLRPDMHRAPDCLHSCNPGKIDVYNQLLLHSLQATFVQDRS